LAILPQLGKVFEIYRPLPCTLHGRGCPTGRVRATVARVSKVPDRAGEGNSGTRVKGALIRPCLRVSCASLRTMATFSHTRVKPEHGRR
jgi:hypothetical protein